MQERRRALRHTPQPDAPLSRVRLRAGRELSVIDVSSTGVLVEGAVRLLPGTHVDVHVMTPHGRLLVRSRVVRACVCALSPDAVTYRGALAFEASLTLGRGYEMPGDPPVAPAAGGMTYPDRAA